jgi:hypothetical protein
MLAEWRKPSGVSREFTVTGPFIDRSRGTASVIVTRIGLLPVG